MVSCECVTKPSSIILVLGHPAGHSTSVEHWFLLIFLFGGENNGSVLLSPALSWSSSCSV